MCYLKPSISFHLQAIMYTINCGMDYKEAGPLGLAGGAKSHRTELPEDIKTFERFQVLCITKK